ncbi:MAG: ribosome maturation factor RimM [Thermodesulfobacteriota bacterium]
MTGLDRDHYIELGKVGRPHGVRGLFRIHPHSGQPENFLDYDEVLLQDEEGQVQPCPLSSKRIKGRSVIVSSPLAASREAAQELVGQVVWLAREQLPPLGEDEFYWHDIIGSEVRSTSGELIGTLTAIFNGGGTEMMVVKAGDGDEVLIPARPEFLQSVAKGEVVVDLPPGLLELNKKER